MTLQQADRQLVRLEAKLRGIRGLRWDIQKRAGEAAMKLLVGEFRDARDPYGAAWKPRAKPRDAKPAQRLLRRASKGGDAGSIMAAITRAHAGYDGPLLVKTGRLRKGFYYIASGPSGFSLETRVRYAAVHQFGGVITSKGGVNRHATNGRFLSRTKALRRSRGAIAVSFTHPHSWRMPKRMMVPVGRLGPYWAAAFRAAATKLARPYFLRP